jgi:hypothetical protein
MMIPGTIRVHVFWKQAAVSGPRPSSLQKTARVHILHRWIFQQTPFNGQGSLQNTKELPMYLSSRAIFFIPRLNLKRSIISLSVLFSNTLPNHNVRWSDFARS